MTSTGFPAGKSPGGLQLVNSSAKERMPFLIFAIAPSTSGDSGRFEPDRTGCDTETRAETAAGASFCAGACDVATDAMAERVAEGVDMQSEGAFGSELDGSGLDIETGTGSAAT